MYAGTMSPISSAEAAWASPSELTVRAVSTESDWRLPSNGRWTSANFCFARCASSSFTIDLV